MFRRSGLHRWLLVAVLASATVLVSATVPFAAIAQEKGKKGEGGKTRSFSFEDDTIEATLLRPETTQVETLNKNKRASLIRIRMTFFAEIIRSAEDL